MNRQWILFFAILGLGGGWSSTCNGQVWRVVNNLDEAFEVRVWPRNNPRAVATATIKKGAFADLKLGDDRHRIQLKSGGGNIHFYDSAQLRTKRETKLRTMLTPKGKIDGRIRYQYMNQDGFNKSNFAGDIVALSRSKWDTKYEVVNDRNRKLSARIEFQGGKAKYTRGNFVGTLNNVRYRPGNNTGDFIIDGRWEGGGTSGRFEFFISKRGKLEGKYWQGQTAYKWTGARARR